MGKCWTELPFQHTGHDFCPSSSSLLNDGCVRSYLIMPKMLQEFDVESRKHQLDPCNQCTRQLLIPLWTSSPAKDHHTGLDIFRFLNAREPDHKGWLLRDRWTARKDPFAEMILDKRESGRLLRTVGRDPAMNVFPRVAPACACWSLAQRQAGGLLPRLWQWCLQQFLRPRRNSWWISWMEHANGKLWHVVAENLGFTHRGGTDHEDLWRCRSSEMVGELLVNLCQPQANQCCLTIDINYSPKPTVSRLCYWDDIDSIPSECVSSVYD